MVAEPWGSKAKNKRTVMPVKHEPDPRVADMKDTFLQQAAELWEQHRERFLRYLEEAETRKLNLSFKAALDFTESAASLETTISYSQVVKDRRTADFDNPNQQQLPGTTREELGAPVNEEAGPVPEGDTAEGAAAIAQAGNSTEARKGKKKAKTAN